MRRSTPAGILTRRDRRRQLRSTCGRPATPPSYTACARTTVGACADRVARGARQHGAAGRRRRRPTLLEAATDHDWSPSAAPVAIWRPWVAAEQQAPIRPGSRPRRRLTSTQMRTPNSSSLPLGPLASWSAPGCPWVEGQHVVALGRLRSSPAQTVGNREVHRVGRARVGENLARPIASRQWLTSARTYEGAREGAPTSRRRVRR